MSDSKSESLRGEIIASRELTLCWCLLNGRSPVGHYVGVKIQTSFKISRKFIIIRPVSHFLYSQVTSIKVTVYESHRYDLFFVSCNTTGDDVAPGNVGLLDQVYALEWIKTNIAGQPGQVVYLITKTFLYSE